MYIGSGEGTLHVFDTAVGRIVQSVPWTTAAPATPASGGKSSIGTEIPVTRSGAGSGLGDEGMKLLARRAGAAPGDQAGDPGRPAALGPVDGLESETESHDILVAAPPAAAAAAADAQLGDRPQGPQQQQGSLASSSGAAVPALSHESAAAAATSTLRGVPCTLEGLAVRRRDPTYAVGVIRPANRANIHYQAVGWDLRMTGDRDGSAVAWETPMDRRLHSSRAVPCVHVPLYGADTCIVGGSRGILQVKEDRGSILTPQIPLVGAIPSGAGCCRCSRPQPVGFGASSPSPRTGQPFGTWMSEEAPS